MPRKTKSAEHKRTDLRGTWFQCSSQHLTQDPICLGDGVYCDREDCNAPCKLVHSVYDDAETVDERRRSWNSGTNRPSIGKLIKQIEDEKEAEPLPVEADEPADEEEGGEEEGDGDSDVEP